MLTIVETIEIVRAMLAYNVFSWCKQSQFVGTVHIKGFLAGIENMLCMIEPRGAAFVVGYNRKVVEKRGCVRS